MKISIITVCKNARELLPKTMESVFSQIYPTIEHLVVDGASTDGSKNFLEEYAQRIGSSGSSETSRSFRWMSEPDRGIYEAMNKGITLSSGDIIAFLNAGDRYLDQTVISDVAERISSDPHFLIYVGGMIGVSKDRRRACRFQPYSEVVDRYYFFWDTLPHLATFYRREVFERYGLFDATFSFGADYEHFVRCFVGHGVAIKKMDTYTTWYDLDGISNNPQNFFAMERERERIRSSYYAWWERWLFSRRIPEMGRIGRMLRKTLRWVRGENVSR